MNNLLKCDRFGETVISDPRYRVRLTHFPVETSEAPKVSFFKINLNKMFGVSSDSATVHDSISNG